MAVDFDRIYSGVFPARAGVILHKTVEAPRLSGFPRTRGGDPRVESMTWREV